MRVDELPSFAEQSVNTFQMQEIDYFGGKSKALTSVVKKPNQELLDTKPSFGTQNNNRFSQSTKPETIVNGTAGSTEPASYLKLTRKCQTEIKRKSISWGIRK